MNRHPRGEVGVLKEVKIPVANPFNRCFLVIEYKRTTYMGCLLVDDIAFCGQLSRLLQRHCGESVEYVGGLDIIHTQ